MQVKKKINAPIETVWKILTDTQLWPVWGPSLTAVDCPQRYIFAGAEGWVKTSIGPWLPFVISRCQEPRYWDWSVAGIPATGHRLNALGQGRCELIFEMPLVVFPYAIICRGAAKNCLLSGRIWARQGGRKA
jgi:hypothetical protein